MRGFPKQLTRGRIAHEDNVGVGLFHAFVEVGLVVVLESATVGLPSCGDDCMIVEPSASVQ